MYDVAGVRSVANLAPVRGVESIRGVSEGAVSGEKGVEGKGFTEVLAEAAKGARAEENAAIESVEAFAQGRTGVHEVMIAQERASIALRYAVTLKNRAIEAYRELMNTQV
ncbi:MAG: flagellar hook-basal body complex protein FliE [Deltaproteobacteria bacterium]|nr:flagellar hook-basal body complex protein FliE [Deltaproteobacteria bacterium]